MCVKSPSVCISIKTNKLTEAKSILHWLNQNKKKTPFNSYSGCANGLTQKPPIKTQMKYTSATRPLWCIRHWPRSSLHAQIQCFEATSTTELTLHIQRLFQCVGQLCSKWTHWNVSETEAGFCEIFGFSNGAAKAYIPARCVAASLSDWWPTIPDSVMAVSSWTGKFMKNFFTQWYSCHTSEECKPQKLF